MAKPASLYEQARDVLAVIDKHLAEAGSNKARILTVTAFVTDITKKSELNRAWDDWVDRANLPMRACIGATLEGDDLIELIVTAAVDP